MIYYNFQKGGINMKRLLVFGAMLSLLVVSSVKAADKTKVEQQKLPLVKCSEPSLTVALGTVECKAQACEAGSGPASNFLASVFGATGGIQGVGKGLGNMLITALKETNCFKIVDLEKFEKVKKQLEATGQIVKPPKIDKFINLTITQIALSRSSGALGGFIPIPLLGAVSMNTQSAELGVDVSVMDPATLEITDAKSFKANSEQTSFGLFGAGGIGGGGLGGGWSWSNNLALDMVARKVIVEAANYLAETFTKDKIKERPVIKEEKEKKTEE